MSTITSGPRGAAKKGAIRLTGKMTVLAQELRADVWIGTPGWQFNRLLDRLRAARDITGDETIGSLEAEVEGLRAALLEILPRVQAVADSAADAYEAEASALRDEFAASVV